MGETVIVSRELLQQLLEALKDCVKALDALHAPGDSIYTRASDRAEIALRDALAHEEQEPVAWAMETEECLLPSDAISWVKTHLHTLPLYTHPPRREWKGLTDKEVKDLAGEDDIFGAIIEFARAIEAKLKEKNNA